MPEPQHGGAATDILVVDSDRPKTGRGRRRNHYNIDLRYWYIQTIEGQVLPEIFQVKLRMQTDTILHLLLRPVAYDSSAGNASTQHT